MSWKSYIQNRPTPTGVTASFKITPEADLLEDGPNCCSTDLSVRGNTRIFRITVKTFPRENAANTSFQQTTFPRENALNANFPPTYVYFKLFKWDTFTQTYLRASQTNMNLYEYNEFQQKRTLIDRMLNKLLFGPATQTEEAQQGPTTPPPPYNVVVEDATSMTSDYSEDLPMADMCVEDLPAADMD
jgi:hypothetical protein